MGLIRRVTLRCICEDLQSDWAHINQRRQFAKLWELTQSDAPDSELWK